MESEERSVRPPLPPLRKGGSSLVPPLTKGGLRGVNPANAAAYRARWIFPATGEPLENATIVVEDGRIADLHRRHDPHAFDLGNVAIVPGLVNAHTHLDLSDITTPIGPATPFTGWLRSVIAHRRIGGAGGMDAVSHGYAECGETGAALIGDIVTPDWNPAAISGAGPRVVAFLELLGLRLDRQQDQLALARRHLEADFQLAGSDSPQTRIIRGLSPHAPYSVHPDLFRGLVDLALEFGAPLAMHLAESQAELELLAEGSGEFVEFLQAMGVWEQGVLPRGTRPLDYLRACEDVRRALVIHGNYLADDELAFLAEHENIAVVYCPRTHAYFGHTPHRWQAMLARGVRMALGTDSRASNPDLDLWSEMLFLRKRHPDFNPARLLQLGTADGAAVLGVAEETGTLAAGKSADMAVISLEHSDVPDAYGALFHEQTHVIQTMCAGRWRAEPDASAFRLISSAAGR